MCWYPMQVIRWSFEIDNEECGSAEEYSECAYPSNDKTQEADTRYHGEGN